MKEIGPIKNIHKPVVVSQFYKEETYWTNKLAGKWERSVIPYPRQKNRDTGTPDEKKMESVEFQFPADIFAKITTLSNESDYRLHMILTAGLVVLINKYTGNKDIVLGTPALKQDADGEAEFINTALALRNPVYRGNMTFKELLLQVRQTISGANENQNYPIEQLPLQLGIPFSREDDFPLFDIIILLENIQDRSYIQHIRTNMLFSFRRSPEAIHGDVEYNSLLYSQAFIRRLTPHFLNLLRETLFNVDLEIKNIDILTGEEKNQLLFDFNDTAADYPKVGTIHELFENQVEKTPLQTALRYKIDLGAVYGKPGPGAPDRNLVEKYNGCCFKKNPFISRFRRGSFLEAADILDIQDTKDILLLKTHKHNYAAVNFSLFCLLDYFDGRANLKSVFKQIIKDKTPFLIYPLEQDVSGMFSARKIEITVSNPADLLSLVRTLCLVHLIEPVDFNPVETVIETPIERESLKSWSKPPAQRHKKQKNPESPVLLLGDTIGTATTGILYLASFLRRNGIEAYCRWNQLNKKKALLKENILDLLSEIRPGVVGVSMKWFPHIARGLEICKIVKEHDPSIHVVIGGNTAAYFRERFIQYPFIDSVVCGDGEVPLLKICRGDDNIPNCLYKRNGKNVETAIGYVQNEENSRDIYLSHLDEVFVSNSEPFLAPSIYVNTGKGCSMNCCYCSGCREVQIHSFNREKPFLRDAAAVRKDILEVKNYTSTFMFDFDLPLYDSSDFHKEIWEGIDLSRHFCHFYLWKLPSQEFIELVTRTFKYSYLCIDLCSLSENHRKKLEALNLVKPQPSDRELFEFFDTCEKYDNLEVRISQIAGLPYFSAEDITKSSGILNRLMETYSSLSGIDWGRLHAQPGAPINKNCRQYNMHSYATGFDEFLHYSEHNFKEENYPELAEASYPFIYFKDDHLNSTISRYYLETNRKIKRYEEKKREKSGIYRDITYEELNGRANRLADLLRKKGVKPDTIVGMITRPSIEMAVGILAVLKAGGAYLPIDTGYPPDRINHIIRDSGVNKILTNIPAEDILSEVRKKVEIIDIASAPGARSGAGSPNPEPVNTAADLAYVIYTSGTTGNPKGVAVRHGSAVNTLAARKNQYKMNPGVTALQLFPYAFDGFVTGFFTPIISGARLILQDEEETRDAAKLKEIITENKVTHFISVPGFYRVLLDYLSPAAVASLKVVTLAGDVLTPDILELTTQKSKEIEIAHEYGVTEAAVMSTINRQQQKKEPISIGKPIPNSKIYILAETGGLRPIGVPGELCISGTPLARGYINNPELTNHKFQVTNSKHMPGMPHMSYIYKTGDLARWLPDGNIEFLGRKDHQVKIRGFRIELGEIESKLTGREEIKEVLAAARENRQGERCLCAYIVADSPIQIPQLKEYLANHLPIYMIPAYIVQLDKIPLTPTGKIDRKALPEPGTGISTEEYTAPRDTIEKKLVEIWAEILGIEQEKIGTTHDFFELGGHSMNLILLISKIHKAFEIEVPINQILENPTIEEISKRIKVKNCVDEPVMLLNPFNRGNINIFCFPPQIGYGASYLSLANSLKEYSWYAFNFLEDLPHDEVLKRYVETIKDIQPDGPYILFGFSAGGTLTLEAAAALENQRGKVSDIIIFDSRINEDEPVTLDEETKKRHLKMMAESAEEWGIGFLKDKVTRKASKYMEYLEDKPRIGTVNAHIHLILSGDNRDAEWTDCWDRYITGSSRIYQGFGTHRRVFQTGFLEKNVEIFRRILEGISKEK